MRNADYVAALADFSKRVRSVLEKQDYPVFTAWRSLYLTRQTTVDGWSTSLGEVNAPGLHHVVVYLDRTLPDPHPHFWVGFFPEGTARARRLSRVLAKVVGEPLSFTDRDVVQDGNVYQFRSSLSSTNYSRPILETFKTGTQSFGRYVGTCRSRRMALASVADAAEFLGKCLKGLEKPVLAMGRTDRDFYERTSERVTVTTRVVPRSSALARRAKLRDQFKCQVCDLDPEEIYGEHGRSCLDAHHVVALAHHHRHTDTLKDLVTVCANCHRVLGKLPPDERGLRSLRRRFRAARRLA